MQTEVMAPHSLYVNSLHNCINTATAKIFGVTTMWFYRYNEWFKFTLWLYKDNLDF